MRLSKIRNYIEQRGWEYQYTEEEGCGSLDFSYRGVGYHVWEFEDGEWGAETNVRNGGGSEDITGEYEDTIIDIIEGWKG